MIASFSYAQQDQFLARALLARRRVGATPRATYRSIFGRALADATRNGDANVRWLVIPARAESWLTQYRGQPFIVLSGESEAHFRDALALLGKHIWYNTTGQRDERLAAEFGRMYRRMLLCGTR